MSFSLELNDDVWIEVEYDLDKQMFVIWLINFINLPLNFMNSQFY